MLFFFDESGPFRLHGENPYQFGVVATVVVPELIASKVQHAYKNYLSALSPKEKDHGEPKGSLLTVESRNLFGELLQGFPDLVVYMVLLDLAASRRDMIGVLTDGMRDALNNQTPRFVHKSMRDAMALLAKQVANLNNGQFARIFALGQAIVGAINASNMHFIEPGHAACYESISFQVDKIANREKIVFDSLLRFWIPTWTHYAPITLVEEVHTANHPLIRKYSENGGIVGAKLIHDNLSFVDSRGCWGVQMADIVANTLYQAARDPIHGPHVALANIVKHGHRFPWAAIRVFSFGERGQCIRTSKLRNLIKTIELTTGRPFVPSSGWPVT